MGAVSCSILYTLDFSNNTPSPTINNNHSMPPKTNLCSIPPFSSTFPRNLHFHEKKKLQFNGFTAFSSSSSTQNQNPPQELVVPLEVDRCGR
ncbi:hypothetical protein V6N11_065404 [Hibiscus sabdariffa]|uniref:Uncharacterized protein n=2 Tax=Hibiscus sabdariffa TaxID=183260 RepID=A0ABR2AM56_9ROSI